ncbi:MAG: class I SAM-dependent methyltransferase [Candidatus Latescibacteria bacterium]|nr:class I SAM-dependent methyltransferase [Candidatus Latescibacterota bacterium]
MMKTDFDRYKDRYREAVQKSIAFAGQDVDFFTEVKAGHLIGLAERYVGDPKNLRVLDVGSGVGLTDCLLATSFGALYGVDIAEGVVEKAAQTNPSVDYQVYDGKVLPFSNNFLDIVFAICVMHHVPPSAWENFIREMQRVTKRHGLVVVFEHNPLNPLTRLAVNRCEFDADAVLLRAGRMKDLLTSNGLRIVERRYILFFPFRGVIFGNIERGVKWLPLGAQYYVAGRKLDT